MKKWIKGLGILGILSLSLIGGVVTASAYGSDDRDTEPYAYVPAPSLRQQLFNLIDDGNSELFNTYGLFEKAALKKSVGEFESESDPYSLEGIQYLENISDYMMDGTYAVDSRPLSHLKNVKSFVDWASPSFSIDYLKGMSKLETLNISLTNSRDREGDEKSLAPVLDISVLDNLDNLEDVQIEAEERFYPTLVLKAGMDRYQLVDPVILSKQFEGATVTYSSTNQNFTIDNGIMTWKDLAADQNKLDFSWSVVKQDGDKSYSFKGEAAIPVLWK